MNKKIILLPLLFCLALGLHGCFSDNTQDRVDKIFLEEDLRIFYPAQWYVEKGTLSDGEFQQDLLVALGDADSWQRTTEEKYEKATAESTAAWYQFGSTVVNGAILVQPYGNVDYIRMDYKDKQYYFIATDKPSLNLFPLVEENTERITYDALK